MSQRPFQLPAVMTSQDGVSQAMSTPSRVAISVATSMSKPTYLSSLGRYFDCGGYAASVDTVSTPRSQISANRSSDASVVSQTVPSASGGSLPEPLGVLGSASPHAARRKTGTVTIASSLRMVLLGPEDGPRRGSDSHVGPAM